MKCPACSNIMIVVEHEHVELDYCTDCAGVWFDIGELELLLDPAEFEQPLPSLDSILTSPEAKSVEKKRKCPICGGKMKKSTVGHDPEVLIDACNRGDGLWFNAGEVGRLIRQIPSTDGTNAQGRLVTFLGEVFHACD